VLSAPSRHQRAREQILAACWSLARLKGLTGFSLKDVAAAVGVTAPSLYSYFRSKHAIYDEMFADGTRQVLAAMRAVHVDGTPREALRSAATAFLDFCVSDPVRHQLLFQRTVPGFEPSAPAYAVAQEVVAVQREEFAKFGITDPAHLDIWTALVSGLAAQQLSNDPGGSRWTALVGPAVQMYADHVLRESR
jgi:AcrR family transcriptional regulator